MTLSRSDRLKNCGFTDAYFGYINKGLGSTGVYIVWVMDKT